MSESKSNWGQKAKVKLKILLPIGATLSPSETVALASMYKEDVEVLKKNKAEVRKALTATERGITVSNSLAEARSARSQAVGTYRRTKDPLKKREWARRMVIADQTVQSIRTVRTRLDSTKDRLTMIMGDMQLQLMEAEAKAQEMEAYAAAGNSLRLAGDKLMQARSRANNLKLEYDNLEVTMEGAEKTISGLSPKELIDKAEDILNRGKDN